MADYLNVVYNEGARPYTEYPPKLCRYLFQAFGMKTGMKLLEPGCGRAEFLRHFQSLGLDCQGLDRSPVAKELAGDIPVDQCDVETERLPYEDNTFDVVYSKSFLEHLHAPDRFLREARRVLKPGGLILSLVPDWESQFKTYFDDYTHRTPFTRIGLAAIYRLCDFERVSVVRFRQLPVVWRHPWMNHVCAAISPFIPVRTPHTFLRWSRELMLLGSACKGRGMP